MGMVVKVSVPLSPEWPEGDWASPPIRYLPSSALRSTPLGWKSSEVAAVRISMSTKIAVSRTVDGFEQRLRCDQPTGIRDTKAMSATGIYPQAAF
jgi:hypothetical protein